MRKLSFKLILFVGLLLITGWTQAALTVQVNGSVYDDVQDVSWDQDANDPLWTSFVPPPGHTLAKICTDGGDFLQNEALAWIAHLNVNAYKGISDWRLWTTMQPDPTCSGQVPADAYYPAQGYGYRCTGSELGHLFYATAPDGTSSSRLTVIPGSLGLLLYFDMTLRIYMDTVPVTRLAFHEII